MEQKAYFFDFDGTLTTGDTLIAFVAFARGRAALAAWLAINSPLLVLMKIGLCSNHKMKQRMFERFFKGMPSDQFEALCRRFAAANMQLLRPEGIAAMRKALEQGSPVMVVSASIDNWVGAFFDLAFSRARFRPSIEGTRIETKGGKLTGRFATPNCYGPEKVRRIKEAMPAWDKYKRIAFGDSRGDKEMLEFADEPHYKPFR